MKYCVMKDSQFKSLITLYIHKALDMFNKFIMKLEDSTALSSFLWSRFVIVCLHFSTTEGCISEQE